MSRKTYKQYQGELDDIIIAVRKDFVRLGEILWDACKMLGSHDYSKLQDYVMKQGVKKTDQRAAIAAFLFKNPKVGDETELRIDPRLIFAAGGNSKVLSLDKEDQDRLLSEETFFVLQPSGKSPKKTWGEMTDHERNMLLGKGGKIRTINEQRDATFQKKNMRSLRGSDVEITSTVIRTVSNETTIQYGIETFIRMLGDEGWEFLSRAHKSVQQERNKAS